MKHDVLRRLVPLTLSAGMFLAVPGFLPQSYEAPAVWQAVLPAQAEAAKAKAVNWEFAKDKEGWKYGGKWSYKGQAKVEHSDKYKGSLQMTVDYRPTASSSWSEVKLEYAKAAQQPLQAAGNNVVSYNLYYQPQNMTAGSLKTKVYAKNDKDQEAINALADIDLDKAKDAGDGWKVVPVKVTFRPIDAPLKYFMVSVVGSNTDYHGEFYIDAIKLGYEKVPDGYVAVKAKVKPQQPVDLAKLNLDQTVPLVDPQATPHTAAAFAYLKALAHTDQLIYAHQNEMNRKVAKNLPGRSDTEDMVHDFSGIVGVDGLALTGDELELTDEERANHVTYAEKLTRLVMPAVKKGALLTMSCHMPNFAEVAQKPLVNGHYDYTGYSPNVTGGNVVTRIMPGGDLNKVYTGYLDMVADFLGRMQAVDEPVIFRPFHENTGSWFWWGAAHCSASEFKNLFRYTVEYMRDVKGLHNLLYAYSPGGPIIDSADYAARYPGDAFIDIVGFDMYHRDPQVQDNWFDGFVSTMKAVDRFASEHDKVAAVTETGVLVGDKGGGLAKSGNTRLNWLNEALAKVAPQNMAYLMTWANFDEGNFAEPYLVTPKRGHEEVNAFINFYNSPQTVFAGQMPNLKKAQTTARPALAEYGYITSPGSMQRLLAPMELKAKAAGDYKQASFVLKKRDGAAVATLPAQRTTQGYVTATLSAENLQAIGKTLGSIELDLDGKPADSISVLYNLPAPPADPLRVDDFESYYGDSSLVRGAYSTNCGAGCSVDASLSSEREAGESGLDFHYHILPGGYAGIIKSLKGADWSQAKGVSFWVKPDGQGQKLICQLNSDGEDFEVDLTDIAKTTTPQVVNIPFSRFVGKNGGTFNAAAVQHFALYCNTNGKEAVDSHFYFDDIKAVK